MQTARCALALCHHGGATGGRRFTSSVLKGLTGTSIALSTIRRSRWLSARLPIDDPRWREAVFEPGTDADRTKGPPPGASLPMRMTASWSGSNDLAVYKSVARRCALNAELPSDPSTDRQTATD